MSENNSHFNTVWTKLLNAMEQMFQLQSLSPSAYMNLYHTVHNYFLSPEYNENYLKASANKPKPPTGPAKPTDAKKEDVGQKDNEKVDNTDIPGSELYFKLKNFLKNYLEGIVNNGDNLKGEDFLRFYAKTWEKYQFVCQIINGIFTPMNNGWIGRQREYGHKSIHDVYTMSMRIWQDLFFKETNRSLTQTCLDLIKDERDGKLIDSRLIRQVVQSYVSVGFIEAEKKNVNNRFLTPALTIYKDYFEQEFLEQTTRFYQLECNNFLANNSINDYLKKITQRFKEEDRRVNEYLHPTTREKLMQKIEHILIAQQLDRIHSESIELIHHEKIEDLRILFDLVNRVANGNEPIQKCLEEYAYKIGMGVIDSKSSVAIKNPKIYVETIIEIYLRFFEMVDKSFCCERGYMAALDKVFSKLVNDNAVTREAKKSTKSPELLARYCDTLLSKRNKAEEGDVEKKLNEIMVVFNYVEDKDVFQKFYGKLLAKRLVGQLSASDDDEESMISKLKAACGFEYASKLQRMFQDIRYSTTLIDEYKIYCENKLIPDIVDFSVMVLTSNSWPFTAPAQFNLSTELKPTFTSFTNFYTQKHNGRKLEWLHQHSKGELQTLYSKPKYTFQVSAYQMAVLLLFNEYEHLTVERMLDTTQLESELFVQVLISLLKSQVLICSEIAPEGLTEEFKETSIKMTYTIQVDENFKSRKIKINLNQPIKSVEQKDTETVNQSIDEDRKLLIQATCVRIMKARKELKHTLLIQEVISQLTSRFKPQIPMIKKCIDMLIEKEYLERDPKERDLFRYLA